MWHRFWENHFIEMAFQVVLKFILLLKFLGQLCMLTKFTNKLVYSTKKKKKKHSLISSFLYLFFPSFVLLHQLGLPVQYGKSERKGHPCLVSCSLTGTSVQFLIIQYDVSYRFFVDVLYQVEKISFYSQFANSFYHEWMLNFVKCFFLYLLIGSQDVTPCRCDGLH